MANGDELGFPEASFQAWRSLVERGLKGADFDEKLVSHTLEGIAVQPLYTADDWPFAEDPAGFPGAPSYRRGSTSVTRQAAGRDARPRYDNPDPVALEHEIAADLARGAHSLWLCFDAQVRAGRANVEPPRAPGERGVPCLSAKHLAAMLEQVPLERVAVSLDAGANALAVAAMLIQAADARGLDSSQLEGWLNADPLAALARDGALPHSIDSARSQMVALAGFVVAKAPGLRAVTVSTIPYHDAGAHAAQELAYALGTGVAYLRWLEAGGLGLPAACAQLAFSFAVGSDFYMEIAKLRAMRQCWANVVAASGGDADDQMCVIHAVTSTRSKTAHDPWVNMLRETTEAFAAVVGGADVLTTGGFDRLLGVSDAFARRIAGNTPVILDEEAHVTRVADPAGGAWYVEALTDRLAEEAWRLFQAIEAGGGMLHALSSGHIATQVAGTAAAREALIAKRKQAITGVSEFANVDETALSRPEPAWDAIAHARGAVLAAAAKDDSVEGPLLEACTAGHGIVEAAIEVAAKGATLAQLSVVLAGRGEPARGAALPLRRHAAQYERLRDACNARARKTGARPRLFLCNLGPIAQHKARAQFATGFFNAGGLAVVDNDGFETPEAAVAACARSGAELAVLCGSDEHYPTWVAQVTPLLLARGVARVVLAGRPGEAEARYRSAGVSDFIYMGCDVVATLDRLLRAIGAVP
jgi:methylmalonyl-CoA mutase